MTSFDDRKPEGSATSSDAISPAAPPETTSQPVATDPTPLALASNESGIPETPASTAEASLLERVGLIPPKDKPDPYAHRRGEPRSFIALWILFVVCAIMLTLASLGARGFVQVEVYRAGLLRLMLALMVGVVLVWPMLRLSQQKPPTIVRSFALDGFIVLLPITGVILPQALPWMRMWSIDAAWCVMVWFAAWAMVVVGVLTIVFSGRGDASHVARGAGAGVLAFVSILPALFLPFVSTRPAGAGPDLAFTAWLLPSPITGLFDIIRDRSWSGTAVRIAPQHWTASWLVMGLGALLVAWGWARSRMHSKGPSRPL